MDLRTGSYRHRKKMIGPQPGTDPPPKIKSPRKGAFAHDERDSRGWVPGYGKFCFLRIVFRTTRKIKGENRANIIPDGDSLLDIPSGEIEHPPPPPPPLDPVDPGAAATVIFTVPWALLAASGSLA